MNTTSILRHINAIRCLRLLKRSEVRSRSDLARELDVTRTTVGNAVKELLDAGLVQEAAQVEPGQATDQVRVGRPGVGISLNGSGAYFVGLDVSTTSMTAVLVDLTMTIVARFSVAIEEGAADAHAAAARFATLARLAIEAAGPRRDRVRGVGVSIPGLVNRDGKVVVAPLLGWRDIDMKALLGASLPGAGEIRVCNDAVALANAICATASGPDVEDLLLILLSEGIGGAAVRRGKVVEGFNGYAGEIGQMIMAASPPEQGPTTFQSLAGQRHFARFLDPGLPLMDAAIVLAERARDAALDESLDRWAEQLATGFINAILLLDPERIVIGGALVPLYNRVAGRVAALTAAGLPGRRAPPISVSRYGGEGAAFGAAAMIREAVFALPPLDPQSPG